MFCCAQLGSNVFHPVKFLVQLCTFEASKKGYRSLIVYTDKHYFIYKQDKFIYRKQAFLHIIASKETGASMKKYVLN